MYPQSFSAYKVTEVIKPPVEIFKTSFLQAPQKKALKVLWNPGPKSCLCLWVQQKFMENND